jgi:hypothetical protein
MPKRKTLFEKGLNKQQGLRSSSRHHKRQIAAKPHYVIVGTGKEARFVANRDKNLNEYLPLQAKGIFKRATSHHYKGAMTGKSRLRNPLKQPEYAN